MYENYYSQAIHQKLFNKTIIQFPCILLIETKSLLNRDLIKEERVTFHVLPAVYRNG